MIPAYRGILCILGHQIVIQLEVAKINIDEERVKVTAPARKPKHFPVYGLDM